MYIPIHSPEQDHINVSIPVFIAIKDHIYCILSNGEVIKYHTFISVVVIELSARCLNTGPEDRLTRTLYARLIWLTAKRKMKSRNTVKPVENGQSQKDRKESILQYFRPFLSYRCH